MSYILDALRRADAERDRGHVPGVHAQPSFGTIPVTGEPRAQPPWVWLGAGALAMTVVGALVWLAVGGGTRPSAAPVAAAPLPTPAPAPAPATAAGPGAVTVATAPAAPTGVVPTPPSVQAQVPASPPPPRSKPKAAPSLPSAAPLPAPQAPAAAPPVAAQGEEKVLALNELPEEIRRQLPAVTVGGSMYSTSAANRVLILNGQVLHEGDRVTPELTLQKIRLKSAVLSFRGYRYAIGF